MRIFIITMDDPVETHSFIRSIIDRRPEQIIGLAIAKGDRLRIGKNRSKAAYLLSLLLIMGPLYFLKNVATTLQFKLRQRLYRWGWAANPSLLAYAEKKGIPTWSIGSPNSKKFQAELKELDIDVIVNQSQSIIKKRLLEIPKIGVINRHNALLPKNRGRLTPFWVLYKGETETGVSIHFVNEGIDAGPIIVQKRIAVSPRATFASLVRKNYQVAPVAMAEALDKLESGSQDFLPNRDEEATYNTVPTLKEAWQFRVNRWLGLRAPGKVSPQAASPSQLTK